MFSHFLVNFRYFSCLFTNTYWSNSHGTKIALMLRNQRVSSWFAIMTPVRKIKITWNKKRSIVAWLLQMGMFAPAPLCVQVMRTTNRELKLNITVADAIFTFVITITMFIVQLPCFTATMMNWPKWSYYVCVTDVYLLFHFFNEMRFGDCKTKW